MKYSLVLWSLFMSCRAYYDNSGRRFPEDFLFGAATSAYQIEGAWNIDGKGPSIWDEWTHRNPSPIRDKSNGDVSANSYHSYKRDVEMVRELGLDVYRFSISWPRIMPLGFPNEINEAGVNYYNNLINELLKYKITPMVTIYHWDLPLRLQNLGGFANSLIANWFEDYAREVFKRFGDRVKLWITFNEPKQICDDGYGSDTKAPAVNDTGIGEYICAKNLAMAHARAYHMYDEEFRQKQGGKIGIAVDITSYEPHKESFEDKYATDLRIQAEWRIHTDPIYSKEGGFPEELLRRVAKRSAEQGFARSRMPEFTEEERKYVRGCADFLGVNQYSGYLVSASQNLERQVVPSKMDDVNNSLIMPEEWPRSTIWWLSLTPESMHKTLQYLNKIYSNQTFFITESGWTTHRGLEDDDRIRYYRAVLDSLLDSIQEGINVKGFIAWSLMDNFEWLQGYTQCFGLYEVNFQDSARPRTPRKSAFVYKHIVKTRTIDHHYEPPADRLMVIDDGD